MSSPEETIGLLNEARGVPWVMEIIDAAPIGMLMVSEDGKIRLVNRELERMFGYERDELLGRSLEMLLPRDARERHVSHRLDYTDAASERRMGVERELFGLRKDGAPVPVDVGLKPISIDGVRHVIATVADISTSRFAEQQLRELNAQLEARNEEQEHFVYSVSHDLKSPLVSIDGYATLVLSSLDSGDTALIERNVRRIIRVAARMRDTLDGLLELSRLGADTGDVRTDVDATIRDILDARAMEIEDGGVEIRVADDLPALQLDRFRVAQVFENLIANALRHGRPDTGTPRIEIACHVDDREARFSVSDNGPGVAEADRGEIFGLFRRLDTAKAGSGVGLAIVRRVARVLGGRVWVESEPGSGATFCFALPRRFVADDHAYHADAA